MWRAELLHAEVAPARQGRDAALHQEQDDKGHHVRGLRRCQLGERDQEREASGILG